MFLAEVEADALLHVLKIDGIHMVGLCGYNGRSHVAQERKVDGSKEAMRLDFARARACAQPLSLVLVEQFPDALLALARDARAAVIRVRGQVGKFERLVENEIEGVVPSGALEGRDAKEHLVEENTKRPPVDCAGVAVPQDDFGREILFGADKRVGAQVGARAGIEHRALPERRCAAHDGGRTSRWGDDGQIEIR